MLANENDRSEALDCANRREIKPLTTIILNNLAQTQDFSCISI